MAKLQGADLSQEGIGTQDMQKKRPGWPKKNIEKFFLPNHSPFPKAILRLVMEKAGMPVYSKNDP